MNDWLPHVLVLVLLIVGPLLDPWMTAKLKQSMNPQRRLWSYGFGMLAMALFAIVSILYSPTNWWVSPIPGPHWTLIFLAIAALAIMLAPIVKPVYKVIRRPELRAKTHGQFEALAYMLPQTRAERWMFLAVCLVAGIGEEIVFRGFLVRYIMASPYYLPAILGGLISAVGFGINHGYQGWKGVLSTGVVGLLFTLIAVATGSLIPGMVIHALVDLRVLLFTLPVGHQLLAEPLSNGQPIQEPGAAVGGAERTVSVPS